MNKAIDDTFTRYFYKQALASLILFAVIGAALCAVGLKEDSSRVFLFIGLLFFAMAAAQFIRDRVRKMSGSKVDEHLKQMVSSIKLRRNALDKLCIDEPDVEGAKVATIYGFSAEPIDTGALIKKDEEDGRTRTSNYQLSVLFFCKDRFYTYSDMRSLVDKERREFGRMWRYGNVERCYIETLERTFPINKDGSKTDTAEFTYLTIEGRRGEHFCFAFDGVDGGELIANSVVEYLTERVAIARRLKEEKREAEAEGADNPFLKRLDTVGLKGSRETRVSTVGKIGDAMKEIEKK